LVDEAPADVDPTAITYEIAAILNQVSVELATDEIALAQTESARGVRQRAIWLDSAQEINLGNRWSDIDTAFASLERIAGNLKPGASK
jgi:hypothetical protein